VPPPFATALDPDLCADAKTTSVTEPQLQERLALWGASPPEHRWVEQSRHGYRVQRVHLGRIALRHGPVRSDDDDRRDDDAGVGDEVVQYARDLEIAESDLLGRLARGGVARLFARLQPSARQRPVRGVAPAGDALEHEQSSSSRRTGGGAAVAAAFPASASDSWRHS
jgi:hypothetical protein